MMKFTQTEAERYRTLINRAAVSLTDEDAARAPMLFERWTEGVTYDVGTRVCHDGKLYKVLIAHQSQSTWAPDVAPSLFAEVLIPDPAVIPDWVQPGSTNPYMQGDKVRHGGKVWVSDIDYNTWEPGVYGWSEA